MIGGGAGRDATRPACARADPRRGAYVLWLAVASREVADALAGRLGPLALPVLGGVDGCQARHARLRALAAAEVDAAQVGLFRLLVAPDAMALRDVRDPASDRSTPKFDKIGLDLAGFLGSSRVQSVG